MTEPDNVLFAALMVNTGIFIILLVLYLRLRASAREACEAARMPFTWLAWIEADRSLCDEKPLDDEQVVLHASVSGGSMFVTVGHLREGDAALNRLFREAL